MTRSIRFAIGLAAVLLALASAPPAAPALEFESAPVDQTFTVGTAVSLTLPRTKLEGQCYHDGSSYTLTPTLPAGLSFNGDYNSRLISGTPTTATAQTQYTYSASNNACYQNTSDNFNITVVTAPDITLSASSVSVTEGGTGTYTVRLKDQPTGNVTVTVSSGDSGAVTASPASLTFTTGNYSTTQTVTLTGAQDADGADETVTITHTASGGGITGETATLTATVTDDDSLTAGSIGETSAILTNYKGSWYYKETAPSTGTCSSAGAGVSVNLTGLTAGTSYTYKAYSDSNCATETGSVTFSTLAQTTVPKMATPTLTSGNKRISLSWSYPQGVPGLQAYRVRYREKGQTDWTYADARSDSGEQNFYGHETGATIPAHETFTMKDSTTYQVQVRAGKWDGGYDGWGAWSDTAEAATDPPAPYFTYWNIEWTGAEIKLHNYTSSWYYKETAPGDGSCTAAPNHTDGTTAVTLTGLQQETPYTYKAYSDSNCSDDNLIATASFTTLPGKVTGVQVTPRDQALAVSWTARNHVLHYWVEWKSGNQNYDPSRRQTVTSNSTTIGSLVNGTSYVVRVAAFTSHSGGGLYSDGVTGTPVAAPALSAGSIEATAATLTLSNHSNAWRYKYTSPSGGQCSAEISAGTSTANVTGLDAGTTYTFKAYSDSNCATELATAPDFITKPGQVTGVSAAAGDRSLSVSWSAVTGAASYKVQWKSGTQEYGSSREATPTGTTHTIPSLTNDTQYTLRVAAVNASGDGAWSADATGTPAVAVLTFSNATATSVRLNLANYTGAWRWKYTAPAGGQCSAAISAGTSFADATGLDAGTTYTFAVYTDSACSATALVTGSVITEPPKVAGVQATAGTASLALSWSAATGAADYVVQWKSGNQDWDFDSRQQVATSNSATISPLVNGTAYTVRVAARNSSGWGAWSDTATGTPSGATLAAGNVQATTATLTISGHSNAAWYYKYTVPATPAGSCSSVVASGTTTASLTGLTQGTTYTFAAYSDSTCTAANLLATASSFLTKPGQVTGVGVNALSGKLEVTWSDMERADSYKVQWKCGTQEYDSSRQASTTGGSTNKYTISNLTNNTTCTVRVAAVNASGDGAWSAEVTGMPTAVTLSAGSVTTTTATLTIAHHTGDWHYKHTSPTGGQCSAAQTGASAGVTDLNQNTSYTFAAYSDSNCSTLLATAAAFTTRAVKVTGVLVNALNTGLRVSWNAVEGAASYKVQWKSGNQNYGSSRQDTATGTQHSITGLTNDTIYTVRVAAVIGGSDSAWSDDATGSPSSVYLSAGAVARNTATLTLGGRTGNWWYTKDGGTTPPCLNTGISGATLSLTGLDAGTEYTIRAFSNSNCGPPTTAYLTEVTFRTAAAVTLSASAVEATTATLTIANHTGNWYYKANAAPHASCSSTAVSATSVNLSGLSTNTNYTYKAYSDSGCTTANLLATASTLLTKPGKPTTPAAATSVGSGKLTITASVTGSGTLSQWQYQQKGGGNYGDWQDISSTSTSLSHTVSGLTNGTDYQFKVRAVNATGDGAASDASTAASPVAVTLGVSNRSATAAILTLGGFAGSWWWTKDEEANCSNTGISGNTLSLSNLTKNTSYTINAWPDNSCGPTSIRLAQHTFTTLATDATLAASSVEATSATLTIANHIGNWYYKYTSPTGGTCSTDSVSGNSGVSLTGLAGNTSYTYKAYSDSSCNTELATALAFLTKPAKPGKPTATAGAGSGKLTLAATLIGGSGALSKWEYTKDDGANWTDITTDTDNNLSYVVSSLTDDTNYTFKVRATNATGTGPISDASDAAAPLDETLTATNVEVTTATLTIANYPGSWHYKSTTPAGTCSTDSVSGNSGVSLTGLDGNTSYTYKAYSNSNCSAELATALSFLTKPGKPTKPTATPGAGSGKLTLSAAAVNGDGAITKWRYSTDDGTNWSDVPGANTSTTVSGTVTDLDDDTSYQIKVRAVNVTGEGAASDASDAATPSDETLAASSITTSGATLTIGNWPKAWRYKYTSPSGGQCSSEIAAGTTTAAVTGLDANTSYTFKAYSDSSCNTKLAAAAAFPTKPAKPDKPTAVSGAGSGKLTLSSSVTGDATLTRWEYKQKETGGSFPNKWTQISDSTSTDLDHTISGLDNTKTYQFKVRAHNASGYSAESSVSDSAQPRDETLAATNVEATTATLTIGNWPNAWRYKYTSPSGGQCSSEIAAGTSTASLTELSTNTDYTFKAYSNSNCSTELATTTLLTKPGKPTKPSAGAGAGSGKLTVKASVTGDGTLTGWQYQQKKGSGNYGSWIDISSTSTTLFHTVSGLTDRADYQFKVRAVNATGNGVASDASDAVQPRAVTLAAGSVEATTATLTLGNWVSDWYYKYTAPSGGTCSTNAVSGITEDLTGLAANTNHTFKAYSDSSCSTLLATASSFLTKPGTPTKPVATSGAGSGKLRVTSRVSGDGTLDKWQYQQKEGSGNFGSWTNISSTSNPLSHVVSGLTNGTDYQFKVRAVNGTGDGAASDASDAARPRDETLTVDSVAAATSAKLTIGNWSGNWHYKYTAPAGGQCSSAVSSSATTVTGLATGTTHTFKAYSDSGCATVIATAADFLTKPGKVANLQVASASGALNLSWGEQMGATSYKAQWLSGQEDWDKTNRQTTSTKTSVTISPLVNGRRYGLRVAAVNATGDGEWSDVVSRAPGETGSLGGGDSGSSGSPPNAPTELSAAVTDRSVTLTWTSGSDGGSAITGWQYRQREDGGAWSEWIDICQAERDTSCPGRTSHTVTGLTNDVDYMFEVRAVNAHGSGATSLQAAAATPVAAAAAALALDASSAGMRSVTLTWSVDPSVTAPILIWQYRMKENPWSAWTDIPGSGPTTTSHTVTGLKPGVAYRFEVRAVHANGAGARSVQSNAVEVYEATRPEAPSGLRIEAAYAQLTLSWTAGGDGGSPVTGWEYRERQPGGDWGAWTGICTAASDTGCASRSSHTVTGLTNGTTYTFQVRAVNAVGPGLASVESNEATPTAPPPSFGVVTINDRTYQQNAVIEPAVLPAASGGDGALTYALTPALPAGLTFDAATRTLSGLPTQVTGPRTYEYTATDADGDRASLTFTITVKVSAAEKKRFNDGLAAQGRALLSGATSVIGERFRNPGASSWSGATACAGAPPESAEPRDAANRGLGTGQDSTEPGEEPRDDASRGLGTGRDSTGPGEDSPPEDCTTGLLNTVAQAVLGMMGGGAPGPDSLDLADADETRPRGPRAEDIGVQPAWNWESLVWGRSFALPLQKPGAPGSAWTLWGAGDIQGFQGDPGSGRYDGQVRSLYLGVDAQWQAQWLAGAALAQSWGETKYGAGPGGSAGQLETTLTSIYPYVRGTLGAGLEVWAMGGYGRGEAEMTQAGTAGAATSDLSLAMGATGARQPMTHLGDVELAVVGGAGYLSLATEDGTSGVADLDVAVQRARLAVEAAWASGGLAPYVQVGGRYDGGAGQTGAGLETVAGLRYTNERLEFEARGRWLATHAAEGYEEYGGLARLAVKPQADGTGFRMAVAPRWGAADGGAGLLGGGAALLDGGAMPGMGVSGVPQATNRALMLESELGYGFAVFERQGVLTPYGGFALMGEETRQYRLGSRLGLASWLNLSLEGSRQEGTGQQPANQGVQLQLEGRF